AGERLRLEQRAPGPGPVAFGRQSRLDRQMPLFLQPRRDFGIVRRLHLPVQHLATGIERLVAIQRHQASSVTRSTSSMVVSPASALAMPSSYIVRMPAARASDSI